MAGGHHDVPEVRNPERIFLLMLVIALASYGQQAWDRLQLRDARNHDASHGGHGDPHDAHHGPIHAELEPGHGEGGHVPDPGEATPGPCLGVDAWPMFRGDASLTGACPVELPKVLTLAWTRRFPKALIATPVIADGRLVIGCTDGILSALDVETGRPLWTAKTGRKIEASALLDDGRVYVGSADYNLYRFAAETGKERWKFATDEKVLGAANLFPREGRPPLIVFGSYDNFVYAVDSDSGELAWKHETDSYVNGTPSVLDSSVVVGGCDGRLRVLAGATGRLVNEVDLESYIPGSVATGAGAAYVGHHGNELAAVRIRDGERLWSFRERAFPFMASPALGPDIVVATGKDRRLHVLDRETGRERWQAAARGAYESSPLLLPETIVTTSKDGRVRRYDRQTGELLWTYDVGADLTSSPVACGGRLFIAAEDGRLLCFKAGDEH